MTAARLNSIIAFFDVLTDKGPLEGVAGLVPASSDALIICQTLSQRLPSTYWTHVDKPLDNKHETGWYSDVKFVLKTGLGQTAIREIGHYLRAYGVGRHWIERYRGDVYIHTTYDKDTRFLIEKFSDYVHPVSDRHQKQR